MIQGILIASGIIIVVFVTLTIVQHYIGTTLTKVFKQLKEKDY